MEHELQKVLEGVEEPVTVAGLEDVMRRAGQRRRASLVAGAAALLAVGAATGALARGPERSTGLAAERPAPSAAPAPDEFVTGFDTVAPAEALTPLFRRDANGVVIRAYRILPTGPALSQDPACAPPPVVQVELSNAAAVSITGAAQPSGDELAVLGVGDFGRAEGEASTYAIVRAAKGTATIRLTSGSATDTMVPQEGIAVLAVPGGPAGGVVEGLGPNGDVVSTKSLSDPVPPPFDPACIPERCNHYADGGGFGEATDPTAPLPPVTGAPPPPEATVQDPVPTPPPPAPAPIPPDSVTGPAMKGPIVCGSGGHPEGGTTTPVAPAPMRRPAPMRPAGPVPGEPPPPDLPTSVPSTNTIATSAAGGPTTTATAPTSTAPSVPAS